MKKKTELKSETFNIQSITKLADSILCVYPKFKHKEFLEMILPTLESLELKERSNSIEDALVTYLPKPFEAGAEILLKALPCEIVEMEITSYRGFILMPQTGYIARCGMNNFELSMKVLYEMTKRFTSEFHIRFFIQEHYKATMSTLKEWSEDENVRVRRLVSEGTRPRLPWASVLKDFTKDPTPIITLLQKLKNDPELYVRRSVANNLNDISKDHPDLVIKTLTLWQNATKEMAWLTKHALRTLLKAGNEDALELLGYKQSNKLQLKLSLASTEVIFGESLEFKIDINSNEDKIIPIMVDFIIYYQKANGTLAPKVFKLTSKKIKPNEVITLNKKHKFADFTTRKHYEGEHKIAIIINGKRYADCCFNLKGI
jgi:3-methyladenine DNA glycosylase AlkC